MLKVLLWMYEITGRYNCLWVQCPNPKPWVWAPRVSQYATVMEIAPRRPRLISRGCRVTSPILELGPNPRLLIMVDHINKSNRGSSRIRMCGGVCGPLKIWRDTPAQWPMGIRARGWWTIEINLLSRSHHWWLLFRFGHRWVTREEPMSVRERREAKMYRESVEPNAPYNRENLSLAFSLLTDYLKFNI